MRIPIAITLAAVCGLATAQTPSTADAWDVAAGTTVLSHSALDDTSATQRYDIRDMFGAQASTVPFETGNIVFEDATGDAGYVDSVEWKTVAPVDIRSYTLYWKDDFPDQNWRNLAHFSLFGKVAAGDAWTLLDSRNTPLQIGASSISGTLSGNAYQFWRSEFTRGANGDSRFDGTRIVELDGFRAVPEPATVATLAAGCTWLLRRRKRR